MGSSQTMSYTVIGDTVNTASRLCSHGDSNQILVSKNVVQELGHELEVDELGASQLKGKSKMVEIFNVLKFKTPQSANT